MATPPLTLTKRQPFGPEALENCATALASGSLSSVNGPFTTRLETEFAAFYGARHGVAASSGTAVIHTAVAALRLEPGTEVIVGAITDAGSVVPLLYEGLIPVFCDLDEHLGMTVANVEAVLTERTGAIMLIHLFGGASDSEGLRRLADERGIILLEDCSQAHATRRGDSYVGTYGHIGMFSMQQSKHMTSGDGGVAITDDDELAARMRLFRDKGWERGTPHARAYPHLGLNYRLTELQSAVALPQLATLPGVISRRRELAARLDAKLQGLPGVSVWQPPEGGEASYWCYPILIDPEHRDAVAARLGEFGLPISPGYVGAPIFECLSATREQVTFGTSGYPFTLAPEGFSYADVAVPGARDALARIIVFWMHEAMTDDEIDAVGDIVAGACQDVVA